MSENERCGADSSVSAEEIGPDAVQTSETEATSVRLPEQLSHVTEPWHRYLATVTAYANKWRKS
jgi:hypothetical protein